MHLNKYRYLFATTTDSQVLMCFYKQHILFVICPPGPLQNTSSRQMTINTIITKTYAATTLKRYKSFEIYAKSRHL